MSGSINELYFKLLFNWKFYLNNHEDLQKNGIETERKAWTHLNKYGYKEKRIPFKDPEIFKQFIECLLIIY